MLGEWITSQVSGVTAIVGCASPRSNRRLASAFKLADLQCAGFVRHGNVMGLVNASPKQ
jgi:hypothetical protein